MAGQYSIMAVKRFIVWQDPIKLTQHTNYNKSGDRHALSRPESTRQQGKL